MSHSSAVPELEHQLEHNVSLVGLPESLRLERVLEAKENRRRGWTRNAGYLMAPGLPGAPPNTPTAQVPVDPSWNVRKGPMNTRPWDLSAAKLKERRDERDAAAASEAAVEAFWSRSAASPHFRRSHEELAADAGASATPPPPRGASTVSTDGFEFMVRAALKRGVGEEGVVRGVLEGGVAEEGALQTALETAAQAQDLEGGVSHNLSLRAAREKVGTQIFRGESEGVCDEILERAPYMYASRVYAERWRETRRTAEVGGKLDEVHDLPPERQYLLKYAHWEQEQIANESRVLAKAREMDEGLAQQQVANASSLEAVAAKKATVKDNIKESKKPEGRRCLCATKRLRRSYEREGTVGYCLTKRSTFR